MPLSDAQLGALCALLDDASPGVADVLERQIAGFPEGERQRLLERLRREGGRPPRLPAPLRDVHQGEVERELEAWVLSPPEAQDLETAALLLAGSAYPLESMSDCVRQLDEMAEGLRARLAGAADEEVPAIAAAYLHGELGFEGDRGNYYDPRNSYLNCVLVRRRGIPISLAAIYLFLGRRLGLPFRGVGMPGHFIVKYEGASGTVCLDPFDGGRRLGPEACAEIVRGLGYHFDPRFLEATTARRITERMVNNLIGIAHREGDEETRRRLQRLRRIIRRE